MKFSENPASRVEAPERFKERLDTILNRPLTVENINDFGDDALNELVELTEKVLRAYQASHHELPSNQKDIEDSAFKEYQLGDIEFVLEQVQDKIVELKEIDHYIAERIIKVEEVTTPPDARDNPIQVGNGSYEVPSRIPRLKTLLYILANDFGIDFSEIKSRQGSTSREMVRQTGYVTVEIPELSRAVLLCDEAENATYVFDTDQTTGLQISVEDLDQMTKSEKNQLTTQYPGIGRRVLQSSLWREEMAQLLIDSITSYESVDSAVSRSEFSKERVKFLSFDKFQDEVRALYPGDIGVTTWYEEEKDRHPNWPKAPQSSYKNSGWQGWTILLDIEKNEFLSFDKFQDEVRAQYPGGVGVFDWYREEKKKHPNWPAAPNTVYQNDGWQGGWFDLFGREKKKEEILPFNQFQEEVKAQYPGDVGVFDWYREEQKKHPTWPSNPNNRYKDAGWEGWREIVGIAFLTFEEFKSEVLALYPGNIPITIWYEEEKKKHPNWPATPNTVYQNDGWQGWLPLFDKERVTFLPFDQFQEELKALYQGNIPITIWYEEEKKKHPNWPMSPHVVYKNTGWKGWMVLFEKNQFLPFNQFQEELKALYPGNVAIYKWYDAEKYKHPNWPKVPQEFYGDKERLSWPELFGNERKERVALLSFDSFKAEVRKLYKKEYGGFDRWYKVEQKIHPSWPAAPHEKYKDSGWNGFSELLNGGEE